MVCVIPYVLSTAYTALVLGQPLPVKPSRIIAGQEPEKTNDFLQAIARAAQKKVLSSMWIAVLRYRASC